MILIIYLLSIIILIIYFRNKIKQSQTKGSTQS
jgi:hypothetical protein